MKHYRFPTIIAVCMAVLLSSCSSDDEGGSNFPASIFQTIQAEWYAPDAARYMKFEYMYMSGEVYQNLSTFPEIAESFSGQWLYARDGGVLDLNIMYYNSLKAGSENYYVLQCDDTTLKIRHAALGLTFDYYKIVESYKARIGDRIDIAYVKNHSDFSSATYTTTNAGIADVDSDGRITVKGGGQAFVTVTSSAGSVVVKVDGGQHVDSYTAEIAETIDQIIARHGEPDRTITNTSGTMSILYQTPEKVIDSAVSMMAYTYYPETRKIRQEEIVFLPEAIKWFQRDVDYLKRNFYLYLNNEGVYAPSQNLFENHFFIMVMETSTANGFIIRNLD